MSHKPMVRWPIDIQRTAVVVVDMMNEFCAPGGPLYIPKTRDIVGNIQGLLRVARQAGLPVIYLSHILRADGSDDAGRLADIFPAVKAGAILREGSSNAETLAELAPEPGDLHVVKRFYDGFFGTDLDALLRARDITTLVICGTLTNVCCDTTARGAVHREYKVVFLSDANATMDYPDMGWGELSSDIVQRVTLTMLAFAFCQVSPTSEVIAEIERAAGGAERIQAEPALAASPG
jgi:ureidoacrylate peracid hydrolase